MSKSTLLGKIARAGLTWMGKRKLAKIDGQLNVAGLHQPVEVLRDRYGIAHIYAQDDHDLFFAQGLVHAQERFWQMELNRRTANGTLSEWFGPLALDTDRAARTFGFARVGRADYARFCPELQNVLQAYTEGVNAYLSAFPNKRPLEFTLLGQKARPWTVEDTLAFSRLMIWQLSHAWYSELTRARLVERVGAEHAAEFDLSYPQGNPLTLPEGVEMNVLDPKGGLSAVRGPFLQRGLGSNAWSVSGERSQSGTALLCNDMHLILSLPNLWYENHLVSPTTQVSGVSIPCAPLVLAGHNADISWGITLAFTDCEDVYVEQFDPADPTRYQFAGEWKTAQVLEERIAVKGQAEHVEKVVLTDHGPVISDAVGEKQQRLAVQSMALRPCLALEGWYRLNKAAGWDDFVEAARCVEAPQLNIVYADTCGNIGYWVTGRTPVRAQGTGKIPAPGWTGTHEWMGEIPFEEMPHALNPAKGYIATCNNKIVPDSYPHYLGDHWMNGYRLARLEEYFASRARLSLEDCAAMQTDVTCVPARLLLPHLRACESQDADVRQMLQLLEGWDAVLAADSTAAAVYEAARAHLVKGLLEPVLGAELSADLLGKGFNPVLFPDHEFYGNDMQAVLRILDDPQSWWLAQAGGKQALIERALREGAAYLRAELGPDPTEWRWGRLHTITFAHAMGIQKPLDEVFNRGPLPVGGDTDTPWQAAWAPGEPFENKLWAPSMRHLFDMGDLTRCQLVLPIGQSGQLGSPHYDDMLPRWLGGQYVPMLWTRSQVEDELEGRLILRSGDAVK